MPGHKAEIADEIASYLQQLNTRQQKTVLAVIKTFALDNGDWWDNLGEEQVTAIEAAVAELEAGEGIPHNEVVKRFEKWL